jgi:hypothetical protein
MHKVIGQRDNLVHYLTSYRICLYFTELLYVSKANQSRTDLYLNLYSYLIVSKVNMLNAVRTEQEF